MIVPILGRKATPHTFRHSYITHMWEESDNLRLAQHLAGHENIRTTSAYCHVTPRKERERLTEYLGEARGHRRRAPVDSAARPGAMLPPGGGSNIRTRHKSI